MQLNGDNNIALAVAQRCPIQRVSRRRFIPIVTVSLSEHYEWEGRHERVARRLNWISQQVMNGDSTPMSNVTESLTREIYSRRLEERLANLPSITRLQICYKRL